MNGVFGPRVVAMLSPETIRMRPSDRVVVVGYQRPRDMVGPAVHELPASGLNSIVLGRPTYARSWPPATNSRPSGSSAWPAQNRLIPEGVDTKEFVSGSQSLSDAGAALNASQVTTLPLESIDVWTATFGQFIGAVQDPTSSRGVPGGLAVGLPTGAVMSDWIWVAVSGRS